MRRALLFAVGALLVIARASQAGDVPAAPRGAAITAAELAVIVNETDPLSVAIGEYYRHKRAIPSANVIRVRFDATRTTLSEQEFAVLRAAVTSGTSPQVQAYALTWVKPYRVECMSITTAFAAGFDRAFCSQGCTTTRWSPYFNSNSRRPFTDFGWRPTMSIAALDFDQARELIDRGAAAGRSKEAGKAYLLQTDDLRRNVRARGYADAKLMVKNAIAVEVIKAPALQAKQDVMFYFIGSAQVDHIDTNRFLPGAVADHLTSVGGDLLGTAQMSSLRWLEAGATGSYGTVVEPCNLPGKFPSVGMLMWRYLSGETLLEAYWKSVAMPGQGLFIGDPLANPFGAINVMHSAR